MARRRDAASARDSADAKRLRELLQTHLQALEEGDEFESPAQLHIDGQMPEGQHPQPQLAPAPKQKSQAPVPAAPPPPPQARRQDALYWHLDIQA